MSRRPDARGALRRGDTGALAQLVAAKNAGPAAAGALRARLRQIPEVSAGYLGLGFAVLGGLLIVRGLASLGWSWSSGPSRWLSLLAWAGLIVTFVIVVVIARRSGGIIPARLSRPLVAVGPLAALLDFLAFALDGYSTAFYPTAVIGGSACLLACLPLQSLRRSVEALVALTAVSVATVVAGSLHDAATISTGTTGMLLGLTPVAAGIWMIGVTDRYVARTIDQAVTESLVTAPARAHSLADVSTLRRLDRDAELLLAGVSRLSLDQPIDPATAASAEVLADHLRLALVSDHEKTWLQIALSESDQLSRTVRVVDPALLAGRLEPDQRRLLLALTWLTVASATTPALDITFVPDRSDQNAASAFTVELSLTGTHRRGIDPAVWPLLSRLGRHSTEVGADRALITVDLG